MVGSSRPYAKRVMPSDTAAPNDKAAANINKRGSGIGVGDMQTEGMAEMISGCVYAIFLGASCTHIYASEFDNFIKTNCIADQPTNLRQVLPRTAKTPEPSRPNPAVIIAASAEFLIATKNHQSVRSLFDTNTSDLKISFTWGFADQASYLTQSPFLPPRIPQKFHTSNKSVRPQHRRPDAQGRVCLCVNIQQIQLARPAQFHRAGAPTQV